ncbi:MAG TPA: RNA polymerase sigma factor [Gemmatimonadaceae bacterium]|nr:RNA polymerase sigma factor [Gemmatimonadaceae bacterium]
MAQPGNPDNDARLVERARNGDERAFETLYRAHVGRVIALCARLAGDRVRAEEIAQDVFVRVWERLAQFRGESAFTTWLHRLTVNYVLNEHRTEVRRIARVMTEADLDVVQSADSSGATSAGEDIDLERAIASLPAGARAVFVLHDVEGYRHEEIATIVGIAVGTSKAHLCRARRLLREALER